MFSAMYPTSGHKIEGVDGRIDYEPDTGVNAGGIA
jgi:hypothetical protein